MVDLKRLHVLSKKKKLTEIDNVTMTNHLNVIHHSYRFNSVFIFQKQVNYLTKFNTIKYFFSTYCKTDPFLGTGDAMTKETKSLPLLILHFSGQENKQSPTPMFFMHNIAGSDKLCRKIKEQRTIDVCICLKCVLLQIFYMYC